MLRSTKVCFGAASRTCSTRPTSSGSSAASKVAITYDAKTVKIQYVSSQKLAYEAKPDGSRVIHPRYIAWVKNLRADIVRDLNAPPEE